MKTADLETQRTEIEIALCLGNDAILGELPIEVRVHEAEATLMGQVPGGRHRQRAESLARAHLGVARVRNHLRVVPQPAQR